MSDAAPDYKKAINDLGEFYANRHKRLMAAKQDALQRLDSADAVGRLDARLHEIGDFLTYLSIIGAHGQLRT